MPFPFILGGAVVARIYGDVVCAKEYRMLDRNGDEIDLGAVYAQEQKIEEVFVRLESFEQDFNKKMDKVLEQIELLSSETKALRALNTKLSKKVKDLETKK